MKVSLIGLVLAIAMAAAAQERPTVAAQPNTVYVGADGKFEAAPDTAVIDFNISAQEENAKAAYDRAARSADQIRSLLRNAGVEPSSAQFSYFALMPVYDYRSPKRKTVGYRVNSNVSVKLKDFSKIGPIVEQLANLDVTQDQSLHYTLEDTQAAKLKAVEDAFHRARSEAEALARAGGRSLGEVIYSSIDTQEQIRPLFAPRVAAMAGAAEKMAAPSPTEEFGARSIIVTAHVNAVFGLK